jgi:hypothetical protein
VKIYLGGKEPVFLSCELSKRHMVRDVIKHVLTLYRKEKLKVFDCSADQPHCFDLRHIDDDSDCDSEDE